MSARQRLAEGLRVINGWGAPHAAAAVITAGGVVTAHHGDLSHRFRLASITKALFAYAVLIAVEEGTVGLEDLAGPDGSTLRHLLAHASGLAFSEHRTMATPGRRRIYSNTGYDVLGRHLAQKSGFSEADYLHQSVLEPLGMTATRLAGSPAGWAFSTVDDLTRWVAELFRPRLVSPATLREATTEQFPGLAGVLPGVGAQRPNPWGLGFEIRGHKHPHWTGRTNSPATFGHFGGSGTMFWVDERAGVALIVLTDREFGPWALEAWPALSDAVLAARAT